MVLPRPSLRLRLLILAYGLAVLIWLGLEDNQTAPVIVLGFGMAAIGTVLWVVNNLGGKTIAAKYVLPGMVLIGGVVGTGTSLSTTGLMFFKNALHAHLFLDYPPLMMAAILQRAPIWGLAGLLAGTSFALIWLAMRSDRTP